MEQKSFALLRRLISDIEGAPYPNTIDSELYTIWYEHVQHVAQEALEFLDQYDPDNRPKETDDL